MQSGFQIFLIIFSSVVGLILLAVNCYILFLYLHPDDKGIFRAPYAKIIIVLGLSICQAQALLVPLDVAFKANINTGVFEMGTFWMVLYGALLAFVCVFIPMAIFFYESDPEQGLHRRLLRTLGYWFITLLISVSLFFISWRFLHYIDLPYTQLTQQYSSTSYVAPQNQSINEEAVFELEASLAVYMVVILSFVGWFFAVCFGGVGLFALPMDLIQEFRHRPRVRKSEEMKETKGKLIGAIRQLIKEGEEIKEAGDQYQRNEQAGCLQKFRGRRKSNTRFTKFKVKYHTLNQQFSLFNLQLKLADTNPIVPFLKLTLGLFFTLTSLLWVIQIIFGNIAKQYFGGAPLIPFLNNLLIYLQENNAGLFSTVIYAYLCLYLMWCVQKGSIKLGIRVPLCCRFYPMTENQTAINGFMVNVLFLMVASVGVTQLCISSFPTYTRFAEINSIFQVVLKYMRFYKIFYEKSIFPIALVCWTFLTLLYLLVTCNRPPRYVQEMETIRKHHEQQIDKLRE